MIYTDVEVNIDLTTILDFGLNMEVLEGESIIVKAEKSMINKGLTASTAIVSSDMLDKLPVTELSDILNLQAGFIDGHLRGGREGEVAYWIDGVPVTDGYDGGTVVDVNKDAIAVSEANKLKIPVIAILDTNSSPDGIDYPIPGNDDSRKSIELICSLISKSILKNKKKIDLKENTAEIPTKEEVKKKLKKEKKSK